MTLNKAKVNADGGLDVFYHERNPNGGEDKRSLEECEDPMLEEHAKAIQALADVAIAIAELPTKWRSEIEVVGFSLYGSEESRKVSISIKRKLEVGGPLVINTPRRHITCEEEFAKSALTDKHALVLDRAEQAALAYLAGQRQTTAELSLNEGQEKREEVTNAG